MNAKLIERREVFVAHVTAVIHLILVRLCVLKEPVKVCERQAAGAHDTLIHLWSQTVLMIHLYTCGVIQCSRYTYTPVGLYSAHDTLKHMWGHTVFIIHLWGQTVLMIHLYTSKSYNVNMNLLMKLTPNCHKR